MTDRQDDDAFTDEDVERIEAAEQRRIRAEMDEHMSKAVYLHAGVLKLDEEAFIGSGHARREPHNTTHDVQPAHDILGCGMKELKDREQTYDAPGGERSMAKTVAAFNAIYGASMTEVQGWQFMALLKMVRANQGKFKRDNFVDQAAYSALAGEAAAKAKG